jgi:hypothetical protein
MKSLFFFLLACAPLQPLLAQADSTISFIAFWEKGDSRTYSITKKQEQFTNGVQTKNNVNAYEALLQVKDVTDKAYRMEWVGTSMLQSSLDLPAAVQGALSKASKKHKDLPILYKTDPFGTYQGIENWKEVSRLVNDLFTDMSKQGSKAEQKKMNAALKSVRDAMSSKEGVEQLILQEIQYMHWPMGMVLVLGDTLEYEDALPNLIGGGTIKALGKVYIQSVDAAQGRCTLVNTLAIDPDEMQKNISSMIQKMASTAKYASAAEKEQQMEKIRETFAAMKMDVQDTNIFYYDYFRGWPVSISIRREIQVTTEGTEAIRTNELLIEQVLEP